MIKSVSTKPKLGENDNSSWLNGGFGGGSGGGALTFDIEETHTQRTIHYSQSVKDYYKRIDIYRADRDAFDKVKETSLKTNSGKVNSFGFGFAFVGGYQFEIGKVTDSKGISKWFISHGPSIGFSLSIGFSEKGIKMNNGKTFGVGDYEGAGSGYSIGLFAGGIDYSGNRRNINFHKSEFIDIQGDDYNQLGFGAFMGLDIGLTWSRTNTSIIR